MFQLSDLEVEKALAAARLRVEPHRPEVGREIPAGQVTLVEPNLPQLQPGKKRIVITGGAGFIGSHLVRDRHHGMGPSEAQRALEEAIRGTLTYLLANPSPEAVSKMKEFAEKVKSTNDVFGLLKELEKTGELFKIFPWLSLLKEVTPTAETYRGMSTYEHIMLLLETIQHIADADYAWFSQRGEDGHIDISYIRKLKVIYNELSKDPETKALLWLAIVSHDIGKILDSGSAHDIKSKPLIPPFIKPFGLGQEMQNLVLAAVLLHTTKGDIAITTQTPEYARRQLEILVPDQRTMGLLDKILTLLTTADVNSVGPDGMLRDDKLASYLSPLTEYDPVDFCFKRLQELGGRNIFSKILVSYKRIIPDSEKPQFIENFGRTLGSIKEWGFHLYLSPDNTIRLFRLMAQISELSKLGRIKGVSANELYEFRFEDKDIKKLQLLEAYFNRNKDLFDSLTLEQLGKLQKKGRIEIDGLTIRFEGNNMIFDLDKLLSRKKLAILSSESGQSMVWFAGSLGIATAIGLATAYFGGSVLGFLSGAVSFLFLLQLGGTYPDIYLYIAYKQRNIPYLIEALNTPLSFDRSSAVKALVKIGIPAAPFLINALKDINYNVRSSAAEALIKIGLPAVPYLIEALKDGDSDVRSSAASALGKIGDKRAVEPLITRLDDKDSSVRSSAASALGKIGGPQAVNALIIALNDPDSSVRQGAIQALGQIGDTRAVEPLIAMLDDKDSSVRSSAASALGNIGDLRALVALRELLSHTSPEILTVETERVKVPTDFSYYEEDVSSWVTRPNPEYEAIEQAIAAIEAKAKEKTVTASVESLDRGQGTPKRALDKIKDIFGTKTFILTRLHTALAKGSESTVRREVNFLERIGMVKKAGKQGNADLYQLDARLASLTDDEYTILTVSLPDLANPSYNNQKVFDDKKITALRLQLNGTLTAIHDDNYLMYDYANVTPSDFINGPERVIVLQPHMISETLGFGAYLENLVSSTMRITVVIDGSKIKDISGFLAATGLSLQGPGYIIATEGVDTLARRITGNQENSIVVVGTEGYLEGFLSEDILKLLVKLPETGEANLGILPIAVSILTGNPLDKAERIGNTNTYILSPTAVSAVYSEGLAAYKEILGAK
jgi:HEAT repeat protein